MSSPSAISSFGQRFDRYLRFICKLGTPPLLSVSVFLFVLPVGTWKAYMIVPSTLFLMVAWTIYTARSVWQAEWFVRLLNYPKRLLEGTIVPWMLHVKGNLRGSVIGNIIIWASVLNFLFALYWLYLIVKIRELVTRFASVAQAFILYFRDPKVVLEEFEQLLKTLKVYAVLDKLEKSYVTPIVESSERGEIWPLLAICFISFMLIFLALLVYTVVDVDDMKKGQAPDVGEHTATVPLEKKDERGAETPPIAESRTTGKRRSARTNSPSQQPKEDGKEDGKRLSAHPPQLNDVAIVLIIILWCIAIYSSFVYKSNVGI
ncbi:unnamed protein product [Sphagnum jensenii]|uniref:Uncharacterized protein n=1 Tax=Sphagnum jensenii TaxID=128206 RepID=A0ABP0VCE2_9BRYO